MFHFQHFTALAKSQPFFSLCTPKLDLTVYYKCSFLQMKLRHWCVTGEVGPLTVFCISDPTNHPSQNSDSKFNIKQGVFKQNPQALESTLISSTPLTKLVLRTLHFILKIQFKPAMLATISTIPVII